MSREVKMKLKARRNLLHEHNAQITYETAIDSCCNLASENEEKSFHGSGLNPKEG